MSTRKQDIYQFVEEMRQQIEILHKELSEAQRENDRKDECIRQLQQDLREAHIDYDKGSECTK